MKNKYLWVGSIISIVVLLDQITKYIVEKQIRLYDVIVVIPGFFNLTHVRNKGAAFGILSTMPGMWRMLFFVTVTVVAIAVIGVLIRKTEDKLLVSVFALIIGGAVGNLIDRVRYGEVVDFIQWHVKSFYWPSFNVADAAISIAVILLAFDMLVAKRRTTNDEASNAR